MLGGWVRWSRPRCPLTVRLTSRLSKVIDWLVLRPLRTLSAALEVKGHLLCKSASFCTVATPGEQRHPHPGPPPARLHPGKMEEASIKAFLCGFTCLYLVKLCTFFMLNAERSSGPSRQRAVKETSLRFRRIKLMIMEHASCCRNKT